MMLYDKEYSCADSSWYLVHCQPRKESYAARSLRSLLKLPIFLPEERVRRHGEVRFCPFFPGYLFVLADLQNPPLSSINACPGVLRLVGFGGRPQSIPCSVVENITKQLEQINGKDEAFYHPFESGDAVHIKSGPLQDLNMVFVGPTNPEDRVHVLLEFMGRLKEIRVGVEMLEKVPGNPLHRVVPPGWNKSRVRYTRGKGRKLYHTHIDQRR